MILSFILIGLVGLAAGAWCFRSATGDPIHRISSGLLPISAAGALVMGLTHALHLASAVWPEAKLAPIIAMVRDGYALYQDPTTGVMTAWIYGPIAALVLAPAALGRDPTTAALIGILINCAVYLAPVAWLLTAASRGRGNIAAAAALVLFAWLSITLPDLSRCAFVPNADGPALGFATCAIAAIYNRRSILNLSISALAVVLCIWSKQNLLPIVVPLIAYVAIVDGFKVAAVYAGMLALIGIVISAALVLAFGASNLWFHMVLLPASHPMRDREMGLLWIWYAALRDLARSDVGAIALLAVMLVLSRVAGPPATMASDRAAWRRWFAARPWSLLLLEAGITPIIALPGYMKIGGYYNNLGFSDLFILLAALTCAIELFAVARTQPATNTVATIALSLLLIDGLNRGIFALLNPEAGVVALADVIEHPYQNSREALFRFCLSHPGEVYCPWNPLTTLLADNKLYHFEWGFLDRKYSGKIPPPEAIALNLPRRTKWIIYVNTPETAAIHAALNGFRQRIELPELPGCLVYVNSPPGP